MYSTKLKVGKYFAGINSYFGPWDYKHDKYIITASYKYIITVSGEKCVVKRPVSMMQQFMLSSFLLVNTNRTLTYAGFLK